MRCPICGAKLKEDKCKYCNVYNKQIIFASNKEAKMARLKKSENKEIYNSDVQPKDVNKVKLWFFLVFGGWFGADSFLTGKYTKGLFSFFTFIVIYISAMISVFADKFGWGANASYTFSLILRMLSVFGVVSFMMWFVGIVQLLTKKYKYPVVMPTLKDAQEMYLIDLEQTRIKQQQKENKKGNNND